MTQKYHCYKNDRQTHIAVRRRQKLRQKQYKEDAYQMIEFLTVGEICETIRLTSG